MAGGAKVNHAGESASERDTERESALGPARLPATPEQAEEAPPSSRPQPSLRRILEWMASEALSAGLFWPEICRELEKLFICKALDRSNGCLQEAADLLGVHRNTLGKKLRQYGLDRRSFKKCSE